MEQSKGPVLSFIWYGKYGGPGWTGGEWGGNNFKTEPIDSLDAVFREHDYLYSVTDTAEADAWAAQRLWPLVVEHGADALFPAIYFSLTGSTTREWAFPWESPKEPSAPPGDPEGFTPL